MSQQGQAMEGAEQRKQPRRTAAAVDDGGRRSRLARHPLLTFIVLTLVISWLPAIPYLLGRFPAPVLASGPFLAAIATAVIVGGRRGLGAFFRRLLHWRVGVIWYLVALLTPVIGLASAAYLNVLLGAPQPSSDQLAGWSLIGSATLGFLVNPFGGAWEEPGWRGYALPLLLRRHSALVASTILGVVWTIWHVPLFVTGLIPWPDAALVFALSFVFTAIFLRTDSVLVAFVFHASINGAGAFFIGLFAGDDRARMYWILAAICALTALVVILINSTLWRRTPAVRENGGAAAGAATGGVRDRE